MHKAAYDVDKFVRVKWDWKKLKNKRSNIHVYTLFVYTRNIKICTLIIQTLTHVFSSMCKYQSQSYLLNSHIFRFISVI